MKKIAVSMKNRFFAESTMLALRGTGNFEPYMVSFTPSQDMVTECEAVRPDLLLVDVTPTPPELTLNGRLNAISSLRNICPDVKIAVICDETATRPLHRTLYGPKWQERSMHSFMPPLLRNIWQMHCMRFKRQNGAPGHGKDCLNGPFSIAEINLENGDSRTQPALTVVSALSG